MKFAKSIAVFVSITLLLFVFILPFSFIHFSTLEDCLWLKPAIDIVRGKTLFKDTLSPYGLVTPFLHAIAVKFFGEYLLPLRIQAVLFYSVTGALLFYIWKNFISSYLSLISLLFWLSLAPYYTSILMPWSSIYALVFQNITFLVILLFIENRSKKFVIVAGIFTALTILTRQPVGVFLMCSIFIFFGILIFSKKYSNKIILNSILLFIFGNILVFIPVIIYLSIKNALLDFWIQSFVFAKEYAKVIRGISFDQIIKSLFMMAYLKNMTYHKYLIWLFIPLSAFYCFLIPFRKIFKKKKFTVFDEKLLFSGLVSLASWMQYYPAVDTTHFYWAVTPIVGFFVYAIYKHIPLQKEVQKIFIIGFTAIIIMFLVGKIFISIPRFYAANTFSKTMPFLKNIRITSFENEQIDKFYSLLKSQMASDDTYINISDDAMVPLIDKRFYQIEPLTYQFNYFAERLYPQYYKKVNDYIKTKHPLVVTRALPYVRNYCSLKNVVYQQPLMGIHVPISRVMDIYADNSKLKIVSKRDIRVSKFIFLENLPSTFSVPDISKLRYKEVNLNKVIPFTIEKGKETSIFLENVPCHLKGTFIIFLDDEIFDSCSFNINKDFKFFGN